MFNAMFVLNLCPHPFIAASAVNFEAAVILLQGFGAELGSTGRTCTWQVPKYHQCTFS